eukprot:7550039-Alexandrium_andersonii.AAC.1
MPRKASPAWQATARAWQARLAPDSRPASSDRRSRGTGATRAASQSASAAQAKYSPSTAAA